MIELNFTRDEYGNIIPERKLSEAELKTVTSTLTDGSKGTITYYQGDKPEIIFESISVELTGPALEAVKNSTSEELEQIATILKPYIK